MAAASSLHDIQSLTALNDAVGEQTSDWPSVWYRGVCGHYENLAGIARHEELNEARVLRDFRRLAPSFLDNFDPQSVVSCLTFAQHYGLPTRLVDWSESMGVALFFALQSHAERLKSRAFSGEDLDLVIWALDPGFANLIARHDWGAAAPDLTELREQSMDEAWTAVGANYHRVQDYAHLAFGGYDPGEDVSEEPFEFPLCFNPDGIDSRIHLQQSCFTVQGRDMACIEHQLKAIGAESDIGPIRAYRVPARHVPVLRSEFNRVGPSGATIFGDIHGLVADIIRKSDG